MKIVTPCEKILRRFPPKTRTRQKEATSPSAWPKFPRLYLMVMILINSPVALYSTVGVVLDRERREKIIPDFPLCLRRRRRLPLLLRLWRIKGSPAPSIPFLGTARPSVLFAPPFPSHTRLRICPSSSRRSRGRRQQWVGLHLILGQKRQGGKTKSTLVVGGSLVLRLGLSANYYY